MPTQITENYWENYHITEKRPKDTTVFQVMQKVQQLIKSISSQAQKKQSKNT